MKGVTDGLRREARDQRRRLSRRARRQEPAAQPRLQPRRPFSDSGRHQDRVSEADRDRDHRRRQAAGRPGGRRDPPVPPAGALQGQGRQVRRRTHLPQGRQEEVADHDDHHALPPYSPRPPRRPRCRARPSAPQRLPLVQAHLRPGHRRRVRARRSPRPRPATSTSRTSSRPAPIRPRPARSASCSPSAPSRPASRTWSSTAAAISFTVA